MTQFQSVIKHAFKYLLLVLMLWYVADWGILEIRLWRGAGMGSVPVEYYLQTPLKGQKIEYDYVGTANQNCSHSLFPQSAGSQWNAPCWWVDRHRQRWQ